MTKCCGLGACSLLRGERQKECLVVCFAYNAYHRRLELLERLWTCGVRAYPVFAGYQDYLTSTLKDMYQYWDKQSLYQDVCNLYRQYRPQVVVGPRQAWGIRPRSAPGGV